jgi:hypothetical protein
MSIERNPSEAIVDHLFIVSPQTVFWICIITGANGLYERG